MFNTLGYRTDLVFRDAPNPKGIIRNFLPFERPLPRIFIAGAQKSGTTSLFFLLCQHPCILPPQLKEPFFFGNDGRFQRGLSSYTPNFPTAFEIRHAAKKNGHECMSFDATTNYLDHPLAAERIKKLVPDAKIIILLRDPVARAHSHYKMAVRNGLESLSFQEAIEKEDERIKEGENRVHNYCRQRLGYRTRGQYAELLPPWLNTFSKEQLLILCAEDFFADTASSYANVLKFLDLPAHIPSDFTPHNISEDKNKPDEKTRKFLETHFEPWNKKLQDLLQQTFPWNYK